MTFEVRHGDCLEVLRQMPDSSVDAIVTDPPYGLSFMGKRWDYDVPAVEIWAECLRVLKPGGHLLAFAGTRTQHRMAVRIEDAGFDIRDMIAWVYGSGFPKSLDVSKAIDKAAGAERTEVVGSKLGRPGMAKGGTNQSFDSSLNTYGRGGLLSTDITAPATDAARQWEGWGTALKPALEPITVARKPLAGTVAENVLAHSTGGLNIDGCRVEGALEGDPMRFAKTNGGQFVKFDTAPVVRTDGRWPANLIHDGSDEVVRLFPQTGPSKSSMRGVGLTASSNKVFGKGAPDFDTLRGHNDNGGSAARFFYCAKASRSDRNEGCEGMDQRMPLAPNGAENAVSANRGSRSGPRENHHPTVKPTDLMRYLCRLVTPPGGVVLDPFTGSGSTGKGAVLEGFDFIGIEREAEYVEIAKARIVHAARATVQAEIFA